MNRNNPEHIRTTEQYKSAVALTIKEQVASVSMIQRHLKVGYNQAARLLETMELDGIITTWQQNGPRKVLMTTNPLM